MTLPIIYDAWGESADYHLTNGQINGNNGYFVATSSYDSYAFRSGYARCAVVNVDPSNSFLTRKIASGPFTTGWFGAYVAFQNNNSYGRKFFGFGDNFNPRLGIYSTGSWQYNGSTFQVGKWDASGNFTLFGTFITGFSFFNGGGYIPDKFDVNFNYATDGFIYCYINGDEVFSYVGDTTSDDSYTEFTHVLQGAASNGQFCGWSECILSDSNTNTFSVQTIVAANYGSTTQWTGNINNINGIYINDSTFDTTSTSGDIQLYQMGSVVNNNSQILAVVTNIRATQGVGSLSKIALTQIIGGTQYITTAQDLPIGKFDSVTFVQDNSPASGEPWQISELNTDFQSGYQATTG